jgi:DNA repair protein RecO (recombination protein O)
MSHYYSVQGIVLEKEDVGEADRVVTVFTKELGKVRLRATSARKINAKLRSRLELFCYSEIAFVQGKIHKTVTDVIPIEYYSYLRGNVQSMRVAYRLAEIACEIIKGQEPDKRIWLLLQETFCALNRLDLQEKERNLLAYYFLWNLLHVSGYGPSRETIASKDAYVAHVIESFIEKDIEALQYMAKQGMDEKLLREVSREHLSQALEN